MTPTEEMGLLLASRWLHHGPRHVVIDYLRQQPPLRAVYIALITCGMLNMERGQATALDFIRAIGEELGDLPPARDPRTRDGD